MDRIWKRDASLWTGAEEDRWLGWLDLPGQAPDAWNSDLPQKVLLGMGGSSLCVEVLRSLFRSDLIVLDSVVPGWVRSVEKRIDRDHTLFIVSSKSGGTIETDSLRRYFGGNQIAITDPGSKLDTPDAFLHVSHGDPTVGGRFSALSNFGMLPARLMGIDVKELLRRAGVMARACRSSRNPGAELGEFLGTNATAGRDKLTVCLPPYLESFGLWIEQLVAESTGKGGTGIIPIVGDPSAGDDRMAVVIGSAEAPKGPPTFRIPFNDPLDIGAEFFRWEFATAVAGSMLGVHPFDQPDVDAAKAAALDRIGGPAIESEEAKFGELIESIRPGEYFAINAYLEPHEGVAKLRRAVGERTGAATMAGYGPRYLHSTGQLQKGGPDGAAILMVTADDPEDVPIPGRDFTFGALKRAQAAGDLEILRKRGRRAIHVHLGRDVAGGFSRLKSVAGMD